MKITSKVIKSIWPLTEHYEYSAEIGLIIRSTKPGWWEEFEKTDPKSKALSPQAAGFRFLEFLEQSTETDQDFELITNEIISALEKSATRLRVEIEATFNFLQNDLARLKDYTPPEWGEKIDPKRGVRCFQPKEQFLKESSREDLISFAKTITQEYKKEETDPLKTKDLYKTHSSFYIKGIEDIEDNFGSAWMGPETLVSLGSLDQSLASAGAVWDASYSVLKNFEDGMESELALVTVSSWSHHAESSRAGGGCIVNNLAVAANMVLNTYKLRARKVAIIDLDAHHGNGTQQIFYKNRDVLTVSIHQKAPFFPGSGSPLHRGEGSALNSNLNIEVENSWGEAAEKGLRAIEMFRPDIILIELSGDACYSDPISNLQAGRDDFYNIGEKLARLNRPIVAEIGASTNLYSLTLATHSLVEGWSLGRPRP